jgi:hypothetical protein
VEHETDSANEAMLLLGILKEETPPPGWGDRPPKLKIDTWAAQAAISRPGRSRMTDKAIEDSRWMIIAPEKLRWPRGQR